VPIDHYFLCAYVASYEVRVIVLKATVMMMLIGYDYMHFFPLEDFKRFLATLDEKFIV